METKLLFGVLLIIGGLYTLYDDSFFKPKTISGKSWKVQGIAAAVLALFLGVLLILGSFKNME